MKSAIISLSLICSFFGAVLSESETKGKMRISNAVIESAIPMNNDKKQPTHIIKWKSDSVQKLTDFEPEKYIRKHYATYQEIQATLQDNKLPNVMANTNNAGSGFGGVRNFNIGNNFNVVVGSFHPSFAGYLSSLDDIEYVEPNRIYRAPVLPLSSEPRPYVARKETSQEPRRFRNHKKSIEKKLQKRGVITQTGVPSWGICRINQRERGDLASYTADESAGKGIDVYIFDTGINDEHPDFGGRAVKSENFIEYEDDEDYAGHGTHVAGTIGGMTYGIAKNVRLHGVKILDKNGDGSTATLIEAISYVSKVAERGRSVINLSLNGPRSQTIDDALSTAVLDHGIPVFVSAGNSGDDACDYSPSANPNVFTVGASDLNDVVPAFSSHGECVRIYAPGTNITSSWINGQSQTMDGTSMANPHVTGIAAMLLSERQFDSADDLYNMLIQIATPGVLKSSFGDNLLLAYNGFER